MTPEEKEALIEGGFAYENARERPLQPAGELLSGNTYQIASRLGKVVVARITEAGFDDQSIQETRARMMSWLGIVMAFEKDRFEVNKDDKMNTSQKAMLLASMKREQDKARIGIFGE